MFARVYYPLMIASFIFSASISTSYAAKIYHWVDEKGQNHYSETPPRNTTSEKLTIRPAGTAQGATSSSISKNKEDTVSKTEEEPLKVLYTAEEKDEFCQQSQNLMKQMNGNPQRRFIQPDGSFRKLSENEIADFRNQAQSGIKDYCQ